MLLSEPRIRPRFGRTWPNFGHVSANLGQIWPACDKQGQTWSMLARNLAIWTNLGPCFRIRRNWSASHFKSMTEGVVKTSNQVSLPLDAGLWTLQSSRCRNPPSQSKNGCASACAKDRTATHRARNRRLADFDM